MQDVGTRGLFLTGRAPVFPSQWGTQAAVSPFPGWENNPPCLEDKGHGGKPLAGRERGRGLQRWEYFKLVHWCFHAVRKNFFHIHAYALNSCAAKSHTRTNTHIPSEHYPKTLILAHITVEQPCDTVSWAPFIAPTVVGFKPPVSLTPSGCLLTRDSVQYMVTFFLELKWSSRASYCGVILFVLFPTV